MTAHAAFVAWRTKELTWAYDRMVERCPAQLLGESGERIRLEEFIRQTLKEWEAAREKKEAAREKKARREAAAQDGAR